MNVKAALAALLGCVSIAAQAVTYELIDLGLTDKGGMNRINQKGDVAGFKFSSGLSFRYVYAERRYEELKDIGMIWVLGLNDRGDMVGDNFSGDDVIWKGKRLKMLPDLGFNTSPTAINNAGQVVISGNGSGHAYLCSDGVAHDMGTLGGTDSFGWAINELGHVVGESRVAGNTAWHAFLYRDGVMHDLGKPAWAYRARAYAVNDSGVAVGGAPGFDRSEAMVYRVGQEPQPLGTLRPGDASVAYGINNAGDIVGWSGKVPFDGKAFIYTRGQMKNLNNLLDPVTGAGWTLETAFDINDRDQISGRGLAPDGMFHDFLLTPIKSPSAAE